MERRCFLFAIRQSIHRIRSQCQHSFARQWLHDIWAEHPRVWIRCSWYQRSVQYNNHQSVSFILACVILVFSTLCSCFCLQLYQRRHKDHYYYIHGRTSLIPWGHQLACCLKDLIQYQLHHSVSRLWILLLVIDDGLFALNYRCLKSMSILIWLWILALSRPRIESSQLISWRPSSYLSSFSQDFLARSYPWPDDEL